MSSPRATLAPTSGLALPILATVLWGIFVLVQKFGWMRGDEIALAHEFWLRLDGARQYEDFASHFFPTYFTLMGPPASALGGAGELGFVFGIKIVNALIALCFLLLLWDIGRVAARWLGTTSTLRVVLALFPFMAIFLTFGRMLEIRPDTLSHLLFGLAWWGLIRFESGGNADARMPVIWAILGGMAAIAAATISARALVLLAFYAPIYFAVILTCGNRAAIRTVLVWAAGFVFVLLGLYLFAFREPVNEAIEYGLLRSGGIERLGLLTKLAHPFRVGMVVLTGCAALAMLLHLWRGDPVRRRVFRLVLAAILAQGVLLAIDPAPFGYAYSYGMVPTLFGLAFLGEGIALARGRMAPHAPLAGYAQAALATALVVASAWAAISVMRPNSAMPTMLRMAPEATLTRAGADALPLNDLVGLMARRTHEHNLRSQVAIRESLCARIAGEAVLAVFRGHPICARDAHYYWLDAYWPKDFWETGPLIAHGDETGTLAEFDEILMDRAPALVFWSFTNRDGTRADAPIAPSMRDRLGDRYRVNAGYAIRRDLL